MDIEMETISVSRSFIKHHLKYKDIYLKYIYIYSMKPFTICFIQTRKLFKMGIKSSNVRDFCNKNTDFNAAYILKL